MKNRYVIELTTQASKILDRMAEQEPKLYRRVAQAIDGLEDDPYQGKALRGDLKGRYSYRIGSYRIIYSIKNHILTVYVLDIGHRRDIYR